MEKKEYVTPKVLEHGDVKEITLSQSMTPSRLDATFPIDTPFEDLTWSP
jgi:hypothetical protein